MSGSARPLTDTVGGADYVLRQAASLGSPMSPRKPGTLLTRDQARKLDQAVRQSEKAAFLARREFTKTIHYLVEAGVAVQAIADHLGVSRQSVYERLKRYGFPV